MSNEKIITEERPVAKYQFSIFEYNDKTNNSAATKAIADCNKLFTQRGYKDYTITFRNNSVRGLMFYFKVFSAICRFLMKIERGSLVGIQYPMLNNVFKYFIRAARVKNIKFFCIVHDIESLRLGGKDINLVRREASNFNFYDCLIVHNDRMLEWLRLQGVKTKMIALNVFDYLAESRDNFLAHKDWHSVVFAGNLSKSTFIYDLGKISGWNFNVYGPNYIKDRGDSENVCWKGVYSPDEVVYKLQGGFGLIWDGENIDSCDDILGNYLKYNNPHKFSLYLAANLPVIAPRDSAIGKLVEEYHIGFLVDNLNDLTKIRIEEQDYLEMRANCSKIRNRIIAGDFFLASLSATEQELKS